MPKHIARLLLLFVGFVAVAITVRNFITDKSFYKYGHYRGDAVAEIARDKPKYQGTAYCQSCHAAQFAEWSKGIHDSVSIGKDVKCEVCHGPAGSRDPQQRFINAATGRVHPDNLKLSVPADSRPLCTVCHEQMPGRPLQQAQIVIADHAGTLQCTLCHNPHSPQTFVGSLGALAHPGDAAAGKKKTATCAACHGADGVSARLTGPTLAGQNQAYLVESLTAYKTGKRTNALMTPMAGMVSDGDIADIAAYFSDQKCKPTLNAADQAQAARKAGASVCTSCHGTNGVVTNQGWPNLAGQSKDYLESALKAYASGGRSNVIMSAVAKGLSDTEAQNVATYYASFSCQ
jgi:cytochrome c553